MANNNINNNNTTTSSANAGANASSPSAGSSGVSISVVMSAQEQAQERALQQRHWLNVSTSFAHAATEALTAIAGYFQFAATAPPPLAPRAKAAATATASASASGGAMTAAEAESLLLLPPPEAASLFDPLFGTVSRVLLDRALLPPLLVPAVVAAALEALAAAFAFFLSTTVNNNNNNNYSSTSSAAGSGSVSGDSNGSGSVLKQLAFTRDPIFSVLFRFLIDFLQPSTLPPFNSSSPTQADSASVSANATMTPGTHESVYLASLRCFKYLLLITSATDSPLLALTLTSAPLRVSIGFAVAHCLSLIKGVAPSQQLPQQQQQQQASSAPAPGAATGGGAVPMRVRLLAADTLSCLRALLGREQPHLRHSAGVVLAMSEAVTVSLKQQKAQQPSKSRSLAQSQGWLEVVAGLDETASDPLTLDVLTSLGKNAQRKVRASNNTDANAHNKASGSAANSVGAFVFSKLENAMATRLAAYPAVLASAASKYPHQAKYLMSDASNNGNTVDAEALAYGVNALSKHPLSAALAMSGLQRRQLLRILPSLDCTYITDTHMSTNNSGNSAISANANANARAGVPLSVTAVYAATKAAAAIAAAASNNYNYKNNNKSNTKSQSSSSSGSGTETGSGSSSSSLAAAAAALYLSPAVRGPAPGSSLLLRRWGQEAGLVALGAEVWASLLPGVVGGCAHVLCTSSGSNTPHTASNSLGGGNVSTAASLSPSVTSRLYRRVLALFTASVAFCLGDAALALICVDPLTLKPRQWGRGGGVEDKPRGEEVMPSSSTESDKDASNNDIADNVDASVNVNAALPAGLSSLFAKAKAVSASASVAVSVADSAAAEQQQQPEPGTAVSNNLRPDDKTDVASLDSSARVLTWLTSTLARKADISNFLQPPLPFGGQSLDALPPPLRARALALLEQQRADREQQGHFFGTRSPRWLAETAARIGSLCAPVFAPLADCQDASSSVDHASGDAAGDAAAVAGGSAGVVVAGSSHPLSRLALVAAAATLLRSVSCLYLSPVAVPAAVATTRTHTGAGADAVGETGDDEEGAEAETGAEAEAAAGAVRLTLLDALLSAAAADTGSSNSIATGSGSGSGSSVCVGVGAASAAARAATLALRDLSTPLDGTAALVRKLSKKRTCRTHSQSESVPAPYMDLSTPMRLRYLHSALTPPLYGSVVTKALQQRTLRRLLALPALLTHANATASAAKQAWALRLLLASIAMLGRAKLSRVGKVGRRHRNSSSSSGNTTDEQDREDHLLRREAYGNALAYTLLSAFPALVRALSQLLALAPGSVSPGLISSAAGTTATGTGATGSNNSGASGGLGVRGGLTFDRSVPSDTPDSARRNGNSEGAADADYELPLPPFPALAPALAADAEAAALLLLLPTALAAWAGAGAAAVVAGWAEVALTTGVATVVATRGAIVSSGLAGDLSTPADAAGVRGTGDASAIRP